MTFRQLAWRTYWRNCVFWFGMMTIGCVSMTAFQQLSEHYRGSTTGLVILVGYLGLLIAAMIGSFKLINDWVRKDLYKVEPREERPRPEDFIWNHPWPVALRHLAFNLFVMLPGVIGGFAAFACAWLIVTFAPLAAGSWLLWKLLGPPSQKVDWTWIVLMMPFSFVSCCGLSTLFVIGFVFDERIKSNPVVA